MYSSNLPHFIRLFNHKIPHPTIHGTLLIKNNRFYGKYRGYSRKLSIWFSEQSLQVVQACTRQFEFIAAQRVRRSLQFFQLYSKIWDEIALKKFMRAWRRRLTRNTKEFLISAVGVTMFNWDDERISDEELYSYAKEIEKIHELRYATVICKNCSLRLIIDYEQTNVEYCTCHSSKSNVVNVNNDDEWQPFIERQDMLIWRKEEKNSGLYAYKVFGTFSDVSAEEFLKVQVDIDYRKVWDPTARELEVIDTDPQCSTARSSHNDVVYWEMIWPRLFSNRDYVYKRQWVVDKNSGVAVIANRITDHPSAPNRPDTYRVTSYWSYTVIKPCSNFNEPGIEFVLTYFEDPGINIPSAVTSWVAMSGLPDFLCRMRQAAKEYKNYIYSKNISEQVYDTSDRNNGETITSSELVSNIEEHDPHLAIIETNETNSGDSVMVDVPIDNRSNNSNNTSNEQQRPEEKDLVSDKEIVSEQNPQEQHGFFRLTYG